jgi:hypothetical protein
VLYILSRFISLRDHLLIIFASFFNIGLSINKGFNMLAMETKVILIFVVVAFYDSIARHSVTGRFSLKELRVEFEGFMSKSQSTFFVKDPDATRVFHLNSFFASESTLSSFPIVIIGIRAVRAARDN